MDFSLENISEINFFNENNSEIIKFYGENLGELYRILMEEEEN